jgi:SAM-dependent methyltransferase
MYPAVKSTIRTLLKQIAFNTPLYHSFCNVYSYMFSPIELMFLAECVAKVRRTPGSIVEVGCAYGSTTVFLNKYMDDLGINRNYYAIDTFSGFTANDIDYEKEQRQKSPKVVRKLFSSFDDNRQTWFDKTMIHNNIHRVRSIQGDANVFDFTALAPIAFCLLDVDLYLPVKNALPKIYRAMAPGGTLVVDDCWRVEEWDGALQAFAEFTAETNIETQIIGRKLGVIRVPVKTVCIENVTLKESDSVL